eukprot:scaffold52289_cov51-Attheya_sp.AAC.5
MAPLHHAFAATLVLLPSPASSFVTLQRAHLSVSNVPCPDSRPFVGTTFRRRWNVCGHHDSNDISSQTVAQDVKNSNRSKTTKKRGPTPSQMKEHWNKRYRQLEEYKEVHGHVRVPYHYPELGNWVTTQRQLYATSVEDDDNSQDHRWGQQFSQLCDYMALYGDTLVPSKFPPNRKLALWVRYQRDEYRNLWTGKNTTLTPKRLEALIGIGFCFEPKSTSWKTRFDELVDFHAVYDHCAVPRQYNENPQLGDWVANQRTMYKNYLAGDNSCNCLTKEKIQALEKLGFSWNQMQYNWYLMFDRLRAYMEIQRQNNEGNDDLSGNGGSSIRMIPPETDEANLDLRRWAWLQRVEHKRRATGRRSAMTQRRIDALEGIGFEWSREGAGTEVEGGGPTVDDWSKLFDEMKESGLEAGMKAKDHWFDGQARFDTTIEDEWGDGDDESLMELWNAEED